jgi:hypothetical protein
MKIKRLKSIVPGQRNFKSKESEMPIKLWSVAVIFPFMTIFCVSSGKSLQKERELWAYYGEQNKKQNMAFGERLYDKSFDLVFSAVITGLSDIGLSVKNMERQSGYIFAEGPMPLSPVEQQKYGEEVSAELNKVSPQHWTPLIGNAVHSFTINVLKSAHNQTKVKLRISTVNVSGGSSVYASIYPPEFEALYRLAWQALERQIFLDEHLDGTK